MITIQMPRRQPQRPSAPTSKEAWSLLIATRLPDPNEWHFYIDDDWRLTLSFQHEDVCPGVEEALAKWLASYYSWEIVDDSRVSHLERALDLALRIMEASEPGDSRAVSDEFVALAAVRSGVADPETLRYIDEALKRAYPDRSPRVTVDAEECETHPPCVEGQRLQMPSGFMATVVSLRNRYDNDIEQLRDYDRIYGILRRLGVYESVEQAWEENPLTASTCVPSDLAVVPRLESRDLGDGIPANVTACSMCGDCPRDAGACGQFGDPRCPHFGIVGTRQRDTDALNRALSAHVKSETVMDFANDIQLTRDAVQCLGYNQQAYYGHWIVVTLFGCGIADGKLLGEHDLACIANVTAVDAAVALLLTYENRPPTHYEKSSHLP